MEPTTSVRLSQEIIAAIEAHLEELSASSAEEYVAAVLRERLCALGFLSPYTPEQERQMEEQLRRLGYLD